MRKLSRVEFIRTIHFLGAVLAQQIEYERISDHWISTQLKNSGLPWMLEATQAVRVAAGMSKHAFPQQAGASIVTLADEDAWEAYEHKLTASKTV